MPYPTQSKRGNKLNVLIADDDKFVRRIAKMILLDVGIEDIVEAANGEEAKEMFAEHRFDLVILDINMPPLDGLSLTEHIRATPHLDLCKAAVVIMTSLCDRLTVQRAKAVGIDQLCLKPLSPENLLRRVEAALTSRRMINGQEEEQGVLQSKIYV